MFTPNNDGYNDMLRIDFFGEIAKVRIFNRWGQLVFEKESEDYSEWDGTNNGLICSDGTYYCIVYSKTRALHRSIQLLK